MNTSAEPKAKNLMHKLRGRVNRERQVLCYIWIASCYIFLTVSCHTLNAEVQEGAMSQLIVQEEQIKNLATEVILELVREQREVLYDALAEVIPPQVLYVASRDETVLRLCESLCV